MTPPTGQNGPQKGPEIPSRRRSGPENGGILQRLRELPRPAQAALAIAIFGLIYLVFGGRPDAQSPASNPNLTNAQALQGGTTSPSAVFTGL